MAEQVIPASKATYTRSGSGYASKPFYTSAKVHLQVKSGERYAYIYFPLSPDDKGKNVDYAIVELEAESSVPAPTYTLQRHAAPATGGYSKMTWNNDPAVLAGSTAVTGTKSSATWSFDVETDVAAWAAGGAYYGFRLITNDTTMRQFDGFEVPDGLVLRVQFSEVPPAPTDVRPSGGVVSVTKPWVQWHASDDIVSAQVQIADTAEPWNKTTGFTSPDFTSPVFSTTVGAYDLATSLFAGFGVDTPAAISVKQVGALGPSEWSIPVEIGGYHARPTLTPSDPAAGSVGDPTPPHIWTPAGVQWQVSLEDLATGKKLDDSAATPGTDTSWTPAKGATYDGQVVRSTFGIIDRNDRIATRGEPVWTRTTVDWTFDRDLGIPMFTSVDIYQIGTTPKVRMALERSEVPDEILVQWPGESYRFDFDENVAGGGWALETWRLPPNGTTEVTVSPIVNNVAGKPYVARFKPVVTNVWLVDETTDTWVSARGTGLSLGQGNSFSEFTGIGATRSIGRTHALRGSEGTVDLALWDDDGRTATEQAANFELLRVYGAQRELRMIRGRQNQTIMALNMWMEDDPENMDTDRDVRLVHWEPRQTDFDDGGLFSGDLG